MKNMRLSLLLMIIVFFALCLPAIATEGATHEVNEHVNLGEILTLYSIIPFVGILLSIALFPLFAPEFWHHHFGKVSAFWAIVIAVPLLIIYKGAALHGFLHILIADYVPFIILLWGLFTISGGILLRGSLRGTPKVNTVIIIIGTILASWMGTTGAAMLLIRPFLRANDYRKNRAFMVVFFIFLVANIGGALTPVGDPPLFLGFLHGVPFFWTFHILPHMLLAVLILLTLYFFLDTYYYNKEGLKDKKVEEGEKKPLSLAGSYNLIFLAGVVGSVIVSGLVDWGEVVTLGITRSVQEWARDGFIIIMGILSLIFTSVELREENEFSWFPIKEVGYLFAGIFVTMTPCLLLLLAGSKGALSFIVDVVKEPIHYFWITGILSSFLDNAPTYLTFFSTALGKFYSGVPESIAVSKLIAENPIYLMAISAGAVFFGANTYIGNAPNFMVRSIAEEAGTPMPSFFGYMLKYSIIFLFPVFIVISLIFF
ncbi:MAG: sodium:proton antiporter [Thermodesulfobacteriota bacterium]|nr:sodium:proton antiporter [Thermodesulfobacteriota bacterium]